MDVSMLSRAIWVKIKHFFVRNARIRLNNEYSKCLLHDEEGKMRGFYIDLKFKKDV